MAMVTMFITRDWLHCADALREFGAVNRMTWACSQVGAISALMCAMLKKALFTIERSLFRPLGMVSQAVHLNGFVVKTA